MKHEWGPIHELHRTCKRCGVEETLVQVLNRPATGDCMGPIYPGVTQKCECGSSKVGSAFHSSWCPAKS